MKQEIKDAFPNNYIKTETIKTLLIERTIPFIEAEMFFTFTNDYGGNVTLQYVKKQEHIYLDFTYLTLPNIINEIKRIIR